MSFPRYAEYVDSGVEWLEQVPSTWLIRRLGHFFSERREKVSDKEFTPLSVTKNGIVPRLDTAAKTQDGDNRKRVVAGDFVINSRSDRKGSSGLSALDGSVSLICIVLEMKEVFGRYAHHLLRSTVFQEEFYRFGKGIVADLWSTNFSEMKNILIPAPSRFEQTQIARFLDHETAKIDALIAEQKRLIKLLQEKRQAVISHAVTKGLDPNVPMKDSGVEWLGEVPAHWGIAPLKHLARLNPSKSEIVAISPDLCSFLPMEKLKFNSLMLDETRRICDVHGGYTYFRDGDVLFAKVTPCFENRNTALARNLTNGIGFGSSEINVFRPKCVDGKFLYYRILEDTLVNYWASEMTGAGGLKRVPSGVIDNFSIAYPSLPEQEEIVAYLNDSLNQYERLDADANRLIQILSERRSALISAAVTGKIDVRDWQPPVDESAFDEDVQKAGMEASA